MDENTATAVEWLQARLSRYEQTNYWRAEQAEEALNILLMQPQRDDPPPYLIRNAMADAAKKLQRRARLCRALDTTSVLAEERASEAAEELIIDTSNLVRRRLTASQQQLLSLASEREGARAVARALNIPLARARERISRARARARRLWQSA